MKTLLILISLLCMFLVGWNGEDFKPTKEKVVELAKTKNFYIVHAITRQSLMDYIEIDCDIRIELEYDNKFYEITYLRENLPYGSVYLAGSDGKYFIKYERNKGYMDIWVDKEDVKVNKGESFELKI